MDKQEIKNLVNDLIGALLAYVDDDQAFVDECIGNVASGVPFPEEDEVGGEENAEQVKATTIIMEGENKFAKVEYTPTCKHGSIDCVWDPAYIYATYPEWYARLYGDKSPEKVGCPSCKNGERYDDEDK